MKEIRGYRKEEMLYPDRCMLKWQGMLLSDHTELMKDQQQEDKKTNSSFQNPNKKTTKDGHSSKL